MKPIRFKEQSIVLQKPSGTTAEECGPLPILQLNQVCHSCWSLDWKERLKILFTGKVWLGIWSGATQPPVLLSAEKIFTTKQIEEKAERDMRVGDFTEYLIGKYGAKASERKKHFDALRVPITDLRRSVVFEQKDFHRATSFGIKFFFGLKIVK